MTTTWKILVPSLLLGAGMVSPLHASCGTCKVAPPAGVATNAAPSVAVAEAEMPPSELEILTLREQDKVLTFKAVKHARKLKENRIPFLKALLSLEEKMIEKEREQQVAKVEQIIADTQAKLKWSDEELQKLDPKRSPAEIRAGVAAKLGAEKVRLSNGHKMMQLRQMDLDGIRQEMDRPPKK